MRDTRDRLKAAVTGGVLIGVLLVVPLATAIPTNDDELFPDEQQRLKQANTKFQGGNKGGSALNMVAVGHNDIGGRGFNADVWVHDEFAYVGHWGFTDWATGNDRFCPSESKNGVAVIDATDPENPTDVSRLENPEGTSAEDVVVHEMQFGPLAGRDIAASGIQVCGGPSSDESFFRGLMLWDVTDPAAPVEVGRINTGCCTRGVHEFEIEDRPDLEKTFAYATVPNSEKPDPQSPSGRRDEQGRGDFRLIDITDPTNPVEVSSWGVHQDLGGPPAPGQGCDPDPDFGHGAEPSDDGRTVFISYWDSGFIAVDVTNPADPTFEGRTDYDDDEDGDGHSASFDDARGLLFTADEDFCKNSGPEIETGYGYLRVFDYSDLGSPIQIGEFRTQNSLGTNDQAAGDFVIHNPLVVGTDVYMSWYTDGIRVVDASDPTHPQEVANFVPPAGKQPVKPSQRAVLTNTTQVWGVAYEASRDLVYASDMNTGLWILDRTDR
jgi:hypothetical protein